MENRVKASPSVARFVVALLAIGLLGFNLANSGAQAVAFSPSSLTGLQFWVDFSDLSTITSSGGFVSQVQDKSGNNRHLTQPTSSNRPAIGTSSKNGLDVLTFDGNDNLSSPAWTQSQPFTMFAVTRNSENNNGWNRQIIGNTPNASPVFYKSGNVWRLYAGSELPSSVTVDTNWHYLAGVVNSGSSIFRVDGAQVAAGNTSSQGWDNSAIAIGSSIESGIVAGWIGDIAEAFIYSRILSSSEITQVESYLNSKWFLAPTTTTSSTTTTTTTTTLAPTTTVRTVTTTAAPALEIVVNAPATTNPAVNSGQATQPTIAAASKVTTTSIPMSPPAVASPATTTTVASSTTSVAPTAPSIQAVAPGSAAVTVGDKTEPVTVKRADNQVTVTAGKLSATLGSLTKSGSITALDNDGNVRLKPGDTVRIKLAGFKPGSTVEAWLFSTPQLMGTAKVGADGVVVGTFTVPKNVPLGSHRIAVVAQTTDGKPATLAVGVMVGNWKKERSITIWLIVLPIVLAIMGALALPATRRRRKNLA